MTDVNVSEVTSSAWWTLFMDNKRPTTTGNVTTPGHITAYNPNSFDDRDLCVLLGSIVLEDTLYDLPGPLITVTVGPFACLRPPVSIDDVPDVFKTNLSINPHVPGIYIDFKRVEKLNHASALQYGFYQKNASIAEVSDLPISSDEPGTLSATVSASQTTKRQKTSSSTSAATSATGPADSLGEVGPDGSGLYTATVIYFDHVLANRVPHIRRSNVVTDANKSD
jgi:hypothetical protein